MVGVGEVVVQVAVNRHEPERPTVDIWFATHLVDPRAERRGGAGLPDPMLRYSRASRRARGVKPL